MAVRFFKDRFICDGVKTTFDTAYNFISGSTLLFVNGIYQGEGGVYDYVEGSDKKSIVTITVLPEDYVLEIAYFINSAGGVAVPPSDFKDSIVDDAVNIFLNDSEFAEVVTYTPYGGTAKLIKAFIARDRLQPDGQVNNRILAGQVEICIANDSVFGVTTINKGQDIVSLPDRIGGSNKSYCIADVLKQDEGMWYLLAIK